MNRRNSRTNRSSSRRSIVPRPFSRFVSSRPLNIVDNTPIQVTFSGSAVAVLALPLNPQFLGTHPTQMTTLFQQYRVRSLTLFLPPLGPALDTYSVAYYSTIPTAPPTTRLQVSTANYQRTVYGMQTTQTIFQLNNSHLSHRLYRWYECTANTSNDLAQVYQGVLYLAFNGTPVSGVTYTFNGRASIEYYGPTIPAVS